MKKMTILLLYALPFPFLPDGSPDVIGPESVFSRLYAVRDALLKKGYSVQNLEAQGEIPLLAAQIAASGADLCFNLCEEFHGQTRLEMNFAAFLELLGLPFTGSPALVLGLSQDKGKTKSILAQQEIPTPAFRVCASGAAPSAGGLSYPLIVKPLCEDASLGIDNDALVWNETALRHRVQMILRIYAQPALVEEYIEGRELNVSIMGNGHPQVLPISEIDFSSLPPGAPKICGYAAKWVEGSIEFTHTVPVCPAALSRAEEKRVREIALKVYRLIDCRDYARVDMRLSPEGIPYVLEINANPDISPDAGMTRSAQAAGLGYEEFIGRIVEAAWARVAPPGPRAGATRVHPARGPRV